LLGSAFLQFKACDLGLSWPSFRNQDKEKSKLVHEMMTKEAKADLAKTDRFTPMKNYQRDALI